MQRKSHETFYSVCLLLPVVCLSCTKLDTQVYDQVLNFWQTPEQVAAGVAPVYSGLRSYATTLYNLNEMSTDEIIVPNRLTDWADDVVWEQLWKHSWGPNHRFVAEGWQFIYGGIANVNAILQALAEISPRPGNFPSIEAELKTVRAFYYYQAVDLYGNVPIVENNTTLSALGTKPRAEVFAYVEKELKENLAFLATAVNPLTYGRTTRWFAQAILAKLYLNAQVFTGTPRWADCVAACDAILQSNNYALEADFFDNFKIANEGSKENIFVLPFDRNKGLDVFLVQGSTLHYNSGATFGLANGGFNGFCSTADYLKLFDPNDKRRKMFLVGQQYVNQIRDQAHLQYDRNGHPLNFDPVITSFKIQGPTTETAGARCAKWEFNKDGWGNMSNDFAICRLADILLMKTEALYRLGNLHEALATINQKINGVSIRSRAGLPDFPASELTPDGLLAERARELSWEGFRRNDMVRLGHFTDARNPEKTVSENFKLLYPIPQAELSKNPYLKQNGGY